MLVRTLVPYPVSNVTPDLVCPTVMPRLIEWQVPPATSGPMVAPHQLNRHHWIFPSAPLQGTRFPGFQLLALPDPQAPVRGTLGTASCAPAIAGAILPVTRIKNSLIVTVSPPEVVATARELQVATLSELQRLHATQSMQGKSIAFFQVSTVKFIVSW